MIYTLASCAVVLASTTYGVEVNTQENLAYVFEMVRHGARAPLDEKYAQNFTVSVG